MPPSRTRLAFLALFGVSIFSTIAWLRNKVVIRLKVDDDVHVAMHGSVPFRTTIQQGVDVVINRDLETRVKLGNFAIHLDESVDVPLSMNISVPIDSDVLIDQPLDLAIDVPIDTVLSEKELDLNQLTIPIDQDVFVNDAIKVDAVVPIHTTVTTTLGVNVPVDANIPLKMSVPIKQKLHVKDNLKLALRAVRVPLKMVVPVHMQVPLHQTFRVRGTISAPIKQTVRVPIRKDIHPTAISDVPVAVKLTGKLPADIKGTFDSVVALDKEFVTRIGPMQVSASNMTLHLGQ